MKESIVRDIVRDETNYDRERLSDLEKDIRGIENFLGIHKNYREGSYEKNEEKKD